MNEQQGYFSKNFKSVKVCYLSRLILLIFIIPFTLLSNPKVNFQDTIINRGVVSQLPVYGSFTDSNVDSIEIIIEFDAILLDIKSVTGGDDFIMKCTEPEFEFDMEIVNQSTLKIKCDDIQNKEAGIFCLLNIEGLAGPDSSTTIKPIKILINGQEVNDADLTPALLSIPGIPVFQNYPENIGNNYPNPFYEETKFPISIHEPTQVEFFIYTNDGRFILSNQQPNDMLKLSFYKNKTEIPISNLNEKLDRGFYVLKLSPDNMRFASGEYYLIMITKLGVYYKNFMYFK